MQKLVQLKTNHFQQSLQLTLVIVLALGGRHCTQQSTAIVNSRFSFDQTNLKINKIIVTTSKVRTSPTPALG